MIFLLIFIAGFVVAYTVSKEFTLLEKLSLAFPVGLGLSSFILFFCDIAFHAATLNNLYLFLVLKVVGCLGLLFLWHKKGIRVFEKPDWKPNFRWFNLI